MLDDVFQLGSFCNPYVKARKRVFVMWLVGGGLLCAVFEPETRKIDNSEEE